MAVNRQYIYDTIVSSMLDNLGSAQISDAQIEAIDRLATAITDPIADEIEANGGGAAGVVWRGAYNPATAYVVNDAVYHASTRSSYICIAPTTGNAPTNPTYWSLLAQGGDDGDDGLPGFVRSEFTASGAAFLDIPIPAGYSYHKITYLNIVAAVANAELWQRFGTGFPSVIQLGANDYSHWRTLSGNSTPLASTGAINDSKAVLLGAAMPTGSSGQSLYGNYVLYNPDNSTLRKQINGNISMFFNNGSFVGGTVHNTWKSNTAITSIRLLCNTGNISGTAIIESYL